ncbi:MAG TPA: hypothetical protein PLA54_00230 [Spirochaetota bacterium]|nr:hypothetical protein [Spirochaetota bacterium]HQE57596.1 hypothetical protein [Spirochaetota bacterium]
MSKLSQSIMGSLTRLNSTVASLAKRAEKLDSMAKAEAKIRLTIIKQKISELEKAINKK